MLSKWFFIRTVTVLFREPCVNDSEVGDLSQRRRGRRAYFAEGYVGQGEGSSLTGFRMILDDGRWHEFDDGSVVLVIWLVFGESLAKNHRQIPATVC